MTPGPEALRQWIERRRLTQRAAAAEIELTEQQLGQVLKKVRRPGLDVAVRIEDATGIPARSWLLSEQGKLKTRGPRKAGNTHAKQADKR